MNLVKHTLQIIKDINPLYYFIENPKGSIKKNGIHARYAKIHGYILPVSRF